MNCINALDVLLKPETKVTEKTYLKKLAQLNRFSAKLEAQKNQQAAALFATARRKVGQLKMKAKAPKVAQVA